MSHDANSLWRRAAGWRWLVASAALFSTLAFLGRPWAPGIPVVLPAAQFNPAPPVSTPVPGPVPAGRFAVAIGTAATPVSANLSDRLDIDGLELVRTTSAQGAASTASVPPVRSRAIWSNASGAVSGGGLIAEYCCAGASSTTVASVPVTSGRHYWEVTLSTAEDNPDTWTNIGVAVANAATSPRLPPGVSSNDSSGGAWVIKWGEWQRYHNGDVFMFALDADVHELYFGVNGVWLNGDPNEQGAGTPVGGASEPLVAAATLSASSSRSIRDRWAANFGAAAFRYSLPNGYGAYGTNSGRATRAAISAAAAAPSLQGEVAVGGQKVPLPDGQWLDLVTFNDDGTGREVRILGRAVSSRLVEMLAIDAGKTPATYPRFASCDRTDYASIEVSSNEASGAQRCWWVNHGVGMWRDQTAFRLARNAAQTLSLVVPDVMLNVSFRKAGAGTYVTAHYYFDPSQSGIGTAPTSWIDSPWHRTRLPADPARGDYVADRTDWGKSWAPVLFAYR